MPGTFPDTLRRKMLAAFHAYRATLAGRRHVPGLRARLPGPDEDACGGGVPRHWW
jgi:hypothetical protein